MNTRDYESPRSVYPRHVGPVSAIGLPTGEPHVTGANAHKRRMREARREVSRALHRLPLLVRIARAEAACVAWSRRLRAAQDAGRDTRHAAGELATAERRMRNLARIRDAEAEAFARESATENT